MGGGGQGATILSEVVEVRDELRGNPLGLHNLGEGRQVLSCRPPNHGRVVAAEVREQHPHVALHSAHPSLLAFVSLTRQLIR